MLAMKVFSDRTEAGRLLGEALAERGVVAPGEEGLLVLAIPRGGVVVGAGVARALRAPLDIWMARKIGAPGNPEFGIGSVASHGECFLHLETIKALGVGREYLNEAIRREREELERRLRIFRGHAEAVEVKGKKVILVDDGAATGSTALAALAALQRGGARERILALPVAPLDVMPELQKAADKVLVLRVEPVFYAVGQFYEQFNAVENEEVVRTLAEFSAGNGWGK